MPTLGAHLSEEEFAAVKLAAQASTEELPGPYAAEAIRERLRREGKMPGAENALVTKLTAKVAVAVRKDPALADRIDALISKSTRRHMAPVA